jgi:flagellar motor protein MotB
MKHKLLFEGDAGGAAPAATPPAGGDNPAPAKDKPADPKGQPPTPPAPSDKPSVQLTKEQLEAAFEHPRFKELSETAQKYKKLAAEVDAAKEAQLKEDGEFQQLAEKKQQELDQMQTAVVSAEIKAEAARLGAVNPGIVAQAIDRAGVEFKDGVVSGTTEAVEALKKSDPYLFTEANKPPPRVGNPTNPGQPNNTGTRFTMTQIRDPKFYREHAAEIRKAVAQGLVDKDS